MERAPGTLEGPLRGWKGAARYRGAGSIINRITANLPRGDPNKFPEAQTWRGRAAANEGPIYERHDKPRDRDA